MSIMSLLTAFSTASTTKKPQIGSKIHQSLRGGMPAKLRINRTNPVLTGSATWDPASKATTLQDTTTVTVVGAALGDVVEVSFSLDLQGQTLSGYVSAADTVTVVLFNSTAGTLNLASGTVSVRVKKATAATIAIYGANIPNPWANRTNTQLFAARAAVTEANLAAGDYAFQSALTYAAFSNYNWVIQVNEFDRIVLEGGSATHGFTITDGGAGTALITFAVDQASGDAATLIFDTLIDSDCLPYMTLQVKVLTVIQVQGTDFTLADNGSGKIRITFTSAPASASNNIHWRLFPKPNVQFGLSLCVPATILAASTLQDVYSEVVTKDAEWAVTGAGFVGVTDASLEPLAVGG
jgi:hypothetical protein